MGFEGVLDGELMEAELGLELPQESKAGLVQSNPDHMPRLARPFPHIRDGNLCHALAARIDRRGDHAGTVLGLTRCNLEIIRHDHTTRGAKIRCQGWA